MQTFLIQRYSSVNWPQVTGERPFIATGPSFLRWVVPGSVDRHREHRMKGELIKALDVVADVSDTDRREYIAEMLLREGIVQALWCVDHPDCMAEELRWELSIRQVADEIPSDENFVKWTLEFLAGLIGPEHCRSYVVQDSFSLEPVRIP